MSTTHEAHLRDLAEFEEVKERRDMWARLAAAALLPGGDGVVSARKYARIYAEAAAEIRVILERWVAEADAESDGEL